MAKMAEQLKATKAAAAKEIGDAHKGALLAINKVKAHVQALQASVAGGKELAKKHEVALVQRIANKASVALNAANLAAELHKNAPGNGPLPDSSADGPTGAVSMMKAKVLKKMAMDKARAEKAARQWKADAAKLAEIESEKAQKSKKTLRKAKAEAEKKVEQAKSVLTKQTGVFNKIEGEEESIDTKARRNAKLAEMVTATFSKTPVLGNKKESAEKASQKAADAKSKEKELARQMKMMKAQAEAAKAAAKSSSSKGLERAEKRREKAKDELAKAESAVADAKSTKVTTSGDDN